MPTATNLENRLTRRAFIKKGLASVIGLTLFGLPSYSFFVEKNNLELTHVPIASPRLPASFSGIRILHLSDIHFGFFYDVEQLHELMVQIQSLKPDIICFTGDLIDRELTQSDAESVSNIFKQLVAPYGKFAVLGNHDYWGNTEWVKECLRNSGFRLLMNEMAVVRKGDEVIYVSGVDDLLGGTPDLSQIFNKGALDPDGFHMMLVHEPDYANELAAHPVDLQLSGHSHGGQVNLPFVGPLITPPLSKKYPSGLYQINHRLTLYTNRGIGTTILPFRFYCRPEMTILELRKKDS